MNIKNIDICWLDFVKSLLIEFYMWRIRHEIAVNSPYFANNRHKLFKICNFLI